MAAQENERISRSMIPHYKLFSFADSLDYLLMFLGSIFAVGNGICKPVLTIFFAELIDSVGKRVAIATEVHEVEEVSLKFLYLALASAVASFFLSVRRVVGDTLALLSQSTATAVAGLVIAFQANWQLALAILGLLPLIGISGYAQIKSMKGFTANAKKMSEEANQVANEAVGSIRTVASFSAEKKVVKRYEEKYQGPLKAGIRHGLISGIAFGISSFFLYFAYAISFYVGALLVHHGKTTFHEVFRVFFALTTAAIGISQSNSLAPDASKARISAASVFEILDQKSKLDPSKINYGMVLKHVKGNIEFKNVSFKYPSRPEIQIFRDLSLVIPSGKVIN
ncbi:hypothetical protein CCACVL1_28676 [Corchorus capsularis]|uniref:ABC transmembrane type-1 domain-containing protein n=1 Tax=Corchorus capsularis TaxID=210143 RepID=A0A1R3G5Q4_COCAP|nr:hypothetical protein CCACVL1_28676 [Corchorus capsularis]